MNKITSICFVHSKRLSTAQQHKVCRCYYNVCECEGLVLLVEIELERGGWGCIFSALGTPQELLVLLNTCHLGIEITWMSV